MSYQLSYCSYYTGYPVFNFLSAYANYHKSPSIFRLFCFILGYNCLFRHDILFFVPFIFLTRWVFGSVVAAMAIIQANYIMLLNRTQAANAVRVA